MIRYLFSSIKEAEIFARYSENCPKGAITVVGEKAENMGDFEDDVLVNIGYAVGNRVPVGALIEPMCAMNEEKHEAIRINSLLPIERRVCFTVDEFGKEPVREYPSIYDRELFNIAIKPHKKLYSVKIVGDRIDDGSMGKIDLVEMWKVAIGYIAEYLKEE